MLISLSHLACRPNVSRAAWERKNGGQDVATIRQVMGSIWDALESAKQNHISVLFKWLSQSLQMHTFRVYCRRQKRGALAVEELLWSRAKLGHVLFPNGDGWESGIETDVHESCQPLPITNAISPPDRMETEWRQKGGREGGEVWRLQTEPVTQLWPHQLFPLYCLPTTSISVDHILLIGLYWLTRTHKRAHTHTHKEVHTQVQCSLNNISEMTRSQWGRTFASALSCSCVMIDKRFKTSVPEL